MAKVVVVPFDVSLETRALLVNLLALVSRVSHVPTALDSVGHQPKDQLIPRLDCPLPPSRPSQPWR
jgi:hypothetical protein